MKIQSVAILGAGAVGCYVLWGLADKAAANTLQLGVVAEGSRAERLRQNNTALHDRRTVDTTVRYRLALSGAFRA